jgi:ATP-dependent helicase/nuclease subunit A
MDSKWTMEQQRAIKIKGCNLLVAAAAGAGKTAVLVERIIRRITSTAEPVDVDRLLVVTFTNAAAAEMRERIRAALEKELAAAPSRRLSLQLALLNRAQITTLHSFCLDVLRQHFYRVGLDPGFRVADETEATLLRLDVLEELLESRYASGAPDFEALVESFGGERDDGPLLDLIQRLYDFSRSNPEPESWLREKAARFDLPPGVKIDDLYWTEEIKGAILLELGAARFALDRALTLCRRPGGPAAYKANLADEAALVRELEAVCRHDWQSMHSVFSALSFKKLSRAGKDVDEQIKKQVSGLRDGAKKRLNDLCQKYFAREPEEYIEDIRAMAPLVGVLAQLAGEFGEAYRRAKQSRGLVDFSDLEHYCLQILSSAGEDGESPVALELGGQFEEVLVDEYQDINPVQEAILLLASRQGGEKSNLFMVGDVKQSIYRFRLAEPGLFLHKYSHYGEDEGGGGCKIDLAKNFRSRDLVLEAVNFIFRRIMTPGVGEMVYDRKAELVCGADYPPAEAGVNISSGEVELHLIDRGGGGENDPDINDENTAGTLEQAAQETAPETEEPGVAGAEARLAAGLIRDMVEGAEGRQPLKVYDRLTGSYRAVCYRDIVVLLRVTRGWAAAFAEEFRQAGVPVYAEPGGGYFDAVEVETVLSLLKIIDNPRQDIPLAGVLRSPLVGLNAGELAEVALTRRGGDFYDAVVVFAGSGTGVLRHRVESFLTSLERWRTMARRGTLADLIWNIYRETGFYDYTGAMPGGAQRQANLRSLHDRARQYEATTLRGLFGFLRFIQRIRAGGGGPGEARTLCESENVVRIMSIHKSKGLEFPVVFVAGLGKKFNTSDLNDQLLLHKALGLGPDRVDLQLRASYPTLAKIAIRGRLKMELLAEEMRILYVALTRAREKLVLVGTSRDLARAAGNWCGEGAGGGVEMPDALLASANSYLDWLGPVLSGHPDGAILWAMAGNEQSIPGQDARCRSRWLVRVWGLPLSGGPDNSRLEGDTALLETIRRGEKICTDAPVCPEVEKRLSWVYPYSELQGRAAKISATELKRRFEQDEWLESGSEQLIKADRGVAADNYLRPGFVTGETGLTAAEAGTALHLVMQHVDFNAPLDPVGIREQVAAMEARELLTREQAQGIDADAIAGFFATPLGRRLLAAGEVRREVPFSLGVAAAEVHPDLPEEIADGETVLVQGVIDCLFRDSGGLVLIDYKTDRASAASSGAAQRHHAQLKLYARAVETITGERIKEKYLYFFSTGAVVSVE